MTPAASDRTLTVSWVLLGFDGRIGRELYWLGLLLLLTASFAMSTALSGLLHMRDPAEMQATLEGGNPFSLLLLFFIGILSIWIQFALGIKRVHDLGFTGFLALLLLLPFLNMLIYAVFGLIPGQPEPNRYGPRTDSRGPARPPTHRA